MYAIVWTNKARRQLARILDLKTKNAIFDKIDELKHFPNCQNARFLSNHKYDGRLRVGKYRVLFKIISGFRVIQIEEVKKRDDQTY